MKRYAPNSSGRICSSTPFLSRRLDIIRWHQAPCALCRRRRRRRHRCRRCHRSCWMPSMCVSNTPSLVIIIIDVLSSFCRALFHNTSQLTHAIHWIGDRGSGMALGQDTRENEQVMHQMHVNWRADRRSRCATCFSLCPLLNSFRRD